LLLPTPGRRIAAQERSITDAHKEPVAFVKFSPDGKTLASACGDEQVKLWDVATGKLQSTLTASGDVSVLGFGANGKTLLTGGRDVAQWDLVTGKKRVVYNCPGDFVTDAVTADWKLAVARRHSALILWELDTGKKRVTLGNKFGLSATAFSPDGRILAVGTGELGKPGELQLWDTKSGQKRAVLKGHPNVIGDVAFSPDGKSLASGGWDGTVRIWDAVTLKLSRVLGRDNEEDRDVVLCIAFSPDGKLLAAGMERKTVRLWDLTSRQRVAVATLDHANLVVSLGFSVDGKNLAAGSGNGFDLTPGRCEIKIWNVLWMLGRD
jgi:WD40 repeat protein